MAYQEETVVPVRALPPAHLISVARLAHDSVSLRPSSAKSIVDESTSDITGLTGA